MMMNMLDRFDLPFVDAPMNLVKESIFCGLLVVAASYFVKSYSNFFVRMPYAEHGIMFLIGVIAHIVAEFSGMNKWYCKHGQACQENAPAPMVDVPSMMPVM